MTAKLGFRKWLELESIKKSLSEATERSDFPDRVFAYLSVAFDSKGNEGTSWESTVISLLDAFKQFRPTAKIPFLEAPDSGKEKPADWDYTGRSWAFWSNVFARTYGWNLEYIADLELNEALALAQEILTDEQLDKEWTYSLSELAYPWNASTKKSVFKPLPRPYWMKPSAKPMKKYKFPRSLLPVGAIQDVSGMPMEYNPLRDTVTPSTERAAQ